MNELDELTRVVDALQRLDVGCIANGALCEHIAGLHRFVHEKGWSISLRADGSVIFEPPLALTA